ncbi:MAG: class I SAM-dependent methyltransferase [Candidatus Moranbacteria bacterium]|nr:class I SAM-dependent methyltransferase [Candidatus Moranbacteria bacterium]
MENNQINKQYNDFDDIYSSNLAVQDSAGNRFFYQTINFPLEGKTVLDVGCGDGTDCNFYQKAGAIVTGVEPSDNFVKSAKRKYPDCSFVVGVGESLPFEDGSFDVVFSKYAVQTSPEVPRVMSEIGRVLKAGGFLVMLSKHPFRQFMEQNVDKNYFKNNITTSNIYDGRIALHEPSHSFGEYFNKGFFDAFDLLDYKEWYDFPASEQMDNSIHPTFFVIKARRR